MQVLVRQLEVGAEPAEVGRARKWVRAQFGRSLPCPACPDETQTDTLVLLVSELVTNAVVHTGRPAILRIRVGRHGHEPEDGDGNGEGEGEGDGPGTGDGEAAGYRRPACVPVCVEVTDVSSRAPRPRHASAAEDTGGRGLELVKLLADRWGWHRAGEGKRVWCELDCPAGRAPQQGRRVPARY